MCKQIISPGIFFIFFQNLYFRDHWGGGGVLKGQKMTQNDKKFCLPHSVPIEAYMIVIFGTHFVK